MQALPSCAVAALLSLLASAAPAQAPPVAVTLVADAAPQSGTLLPPAP